MKRCSLCKIPKPESDFSKAAGHKDGLQAHCKICQHTEYVDKCIRKGKLNVKGFPKYSTFMPEVGQGFRAYAKSDHPHHEHIASPFVRIPNEGKSRLVLGFSEKYPEIKGWCLHSSDFYFKS